MKYLNYHIFVSHFIFHTNEYIIVLFIYGRVIVGTGVCMKTITCEENNVIIKILCAGLALQSYYYISKMVGILRSRIMENAERKKKGIKLRWFTSLSQKDL